MPGGYIRSFLLSKAVCTDTENNRIRRDKRYEEELKAMYTPASYMSVPVNERFAQIVKEKKENEIIAILKVLDPRIIDMQLVDTELLVDIGLSHRLPVNVMGDGMRKLISIILSVYSCKDGVLMIDEVDNGFHYNNNASAVEGFADSCEG